jgi:hypothetical protein
MNKTNLIFLNFSFCHASQSTTGMVLSFHEPWYYAENICHRHIFDHLPRDTLQNCSVTYGTSVSERCAVIACCYTS